MSQSTQPRYDFAAAARVALPLRQKLNAWSRKAAELFTEQWASVSQSTISVSGRNIDAQAFQKIQASWPTRSCGVPIEFPQHSVSALLVTENRELRILLMDMLGGDEAGINDRELTPVECSLAEMVFELVVVSFSEGWFDQEPLAFELGSLDVLPNRNRMFPADRELLIFGLQVEIEGYLATLQLVMAKETARQMLRVESLDRPAGNSGKRIPEEQISRIEVKIEAELGRAEISMPDLVGLSPGDIVVLEQPIDEPIPVTANGQLMGRAWPGRHANLQVLKIESLS